MDKWGYRLIGTLSYLFSLIDPRLSVFAHRFSVISFLVERRFIPSPGWHNKKHYCLTFAVENTGALPRLFFFHKMLGDSQVNADRRFFFCGVERSRAKLRLTGRSLYTLTLFPRRDRHCCGTMLH
jgi:hypothetical protein